MGGWNDGGPSHSAIESVAFLTRSEHRVHVLELLDQGPCTRDKLKERMNVSRVTLSRILGDLTDRGWITRNTSENVYTLTNFGELVYTDFSRLLGTVSVGSEYPNIVERLPTEWFDFDLRCLADSELVAGESADPLSAARVVANAVQNASSCDSFLGTFITLPMYTYEEAVRAGNEPETTVVFDADVTETMLTDSDLVNRWQEIEGATESVVYYCVENRVPCSIDLIDEETVFLTVDREQQSGFDIIRSTHPEVVEWAQKVLEEYQAIATPLKQRASNSET
ncbi:MarR family transcriptional regulator [Haloferax mediterranei ATCC 33500]|uniref:MarR family transcriptional regulator n=1 Tax=Haloferax mediterranei (strain ATCC 33500 / DSM 1411 / JCM 8866 / NBRC 14739 / NCIMB 2177 / R-4) TaxID=523841 RepID=I3R6K3_HALMT|nr:hypothetical protein HFX_2174 [Haloferax mediterranei ATCC 33500]ELZ99830.1 hypothetical protein C439_12679 [Haloferax mediterranei ATCC 33500]QCQ73895.1 MarR family transcriptional regulator [Haloferax mediterranei ATCC 33500]